MAGVLSLLSFFGILIGLVSLVYPLRFMYIRDRRTAAIVLAASVVTFLPATVIDGVQQQQARAGAEQAAAAAPSPQKTAAQRVDEACNISGAIPNCKEVLTKLIAEEMANPEAPAPSSAQAQTAQRAKWTKLRPDLDAHEYWARRCQPYVDRFHSLEKVSQTSMDTALAMLAIRACTEYEDHENNNTASMRELFETCLNKCERLPKPATLSAQDVPTQRTSR
jgi:hypothetical protein